MASKKTRIFEISTNKKGFVTKLKEGQDNLNFDDLKMLRNLLSNEKARILYTIKTKEPESIYQLSKLLERDLKSVRKDVALLKRFGFITSSQNKTGGRIAHRLEVAVDRMEFILKI